MSFKAPKRCTHCGKEFIPRGDCVSRSSKYCSRDCCWAAQKERAAQNIPQRDELESALQEEGSTAGVGRRYGRSPSWAKKALVTRGIPETPRKGSVITSCAFCGTEFETKRSDLARGKGRFCSVKCRGAGLPSPASSLAARRKISESKLGARNPMWRGDDTRGSVYRVFNVRLKGESCCRNCESTRWLHLHHVVPRSMCKAGVRDLRNGVTLCAACHLGWHRRTVTLHREILTAEEWAFVSALPLLGQRIGAWLDDRYPPMRFVPERSVA